MRHRRRAIVLGSVGTEGVGATCVDGLALLQLALLEPPPSRAPATVTATGVDGVSPRASRRRAAVSGGSGGESGESGERPAMSGAAPPC